MHQHPVTEIRLIGLYRQMGDPCSITFLFGNVIMIDEHFQYLTAHGRAS